jgi:acetone carboxylase gamma subunit
MKISEYIELDIDARTVSCTECGEVICDASENYKEHTALYERPIDEANTAFLPPTEVLPGASDIDLRQFCCPNCATLLDTQVAPSDAEILHDIDLDVDRLASQ